jgi:hypothetical protein
VLVFADFDPIGCARACRDRMDPGRVVEAMGFAEVRPTKFCGGTLSALPR